MRPLPGLAGVAALAIAAAGLAGRTGAASDAVSEQDPIATETPVVTASPTATALPGEHTVAGAVEFVRAYLAESNHAYATGNVALLKASSGDECAACRAILSSIDHTYSTVGTVVGAQTTVHGVESFTTRLSTPMQINAVISSTAGAFRSSDGATRSVIPLVMTIAAALRLFVLSPSRPKRYFGSGSARPNERPAR